MRISSSVGWVLSLSCAWLVWYQNNKTIGDQKFAPEWEIAGSTETFDKCQRLKNELFEAHFERFIADKDRPYKQVSANIYSRGSTDTKDGEVVTRAGSEIYHSSPNSRVNVKYSCWPENLDPRH